VKVKLSLPQGIDEMVTCCCGLLAVSVPLDGFIDVPVPPIPTKENQFKLPGEVSPTVTVQV